MHKQAMKGGSLVRHWESRGEGLFWDSRQHLFQWQAVGDLEGDLLGLSGGLQGLQLQSSNSN